MIAAGLTFFHGDFDKVCAKLKIISFSFSHIILFANSHRDEFVEFARGLPGLTVLGTGENVGLSIALNNIWRKARSYDCLAVMLLDQDTELNNDFLGQMPKLLAQLLTQTEVAAIFPRLIAPNGFKTPRVFRKGHNAFSSSLQAVSFAPISGGMYKISVLERYPFSERLFIDLIDVEWGLRVNKVGLKLLMSSGFKLVHTVGVGTLGRTFLRIPLQPDWRYESYILSTLFLGTQIHVSLTWKVRLLAQSVRIAFVRLVFRNGRWKFVSDLIQKRVLKS
jgi:rhamnosyltransferase